MLNHKHLSTSYVILCAAILILHSGVSAQEAYFQAPGGVGSFNDAQNWLAYSDTDPMPPLGNLPNSGISTIIGSPRIPCPQQAVFAEPVSTAVRDLFIGYNAPGGASVIIDNPSACLLMQRAAIGLGAEGVLDIKLGRAELTLRETSYIGLKQAGIGSVIIGSGGTLQCTPGDLSDELHLGYNQAQGNIDISGGTLDAVDCNLVLGGNGGQGALQIDNLGEVKLNTLTAAGLAIFDLTIRDGMFNSIDITDEMILNDQSFLNVKFAGQKPQAGDEFVLFSYGSLTGQFQPERISIDGAFCELNMGSGTDDVVLLHVIHTPEPTTLIIFTLGIPAGFRRRVSR